MTENFKTQNFAEGVWHIEDSRGGVLYLVAGTEHALLIDTGWGTGNLPKYIASLTSLPVYVVNTHGHRDHTSGNDQFPEVYIHMDDLPLVDETSTHYIPIHDGYIFDLGKRLIRVIRVSGHSPGSICLLDTQTRTLFSGDTPRPGPIWLHLETSLTVQEFSRSLRHLLEFEEEFDILAPSHGAPEPAGSQLQDLLACAEGIVSGALSGTPHESRFGECLLAEYGSAAILYQAERVQRQFSWRSGKRLISPEVHADRTVTFRVKAPNARIVLLSSTPVMNALGSADSAIAFHAPNDEGLWSLTLGPLPPDIYDYAFIIDGTAFTDPINADLQTGLSSPRSLLTVPPDDEHRYYELQEVPHGTLHRHTYTSKILNDSRHFTVYTPPGYDAHPDQRYPVLYLLHGGGDDDQGWTAMGKVHRMMDNLLAKGKAQPMIIVMPLGQAVPRSSSWDTLRQKNTPLFEQDFFAHVMPLAESTYRILANRDHRAMAGLSMGGGQTDQIGLTHLDTFSYIGILSAGMRDFTERHAGLLADVVSTNAQLNLLFIGCGTLDPLAYEGTTALHKLLNDQGIEHVYWTLEGAGHTWIVWRTALYHEFLPLLWRK